MREIKFRFWDKDLKKMCFRHPAKMDFSHPNILPMQFTGITDKNGKEIYEGDLHITEAEVDGKMQKNYLPVVFENGAFWLDESFKKDGTYLTLLCQYEDEPLNIVGNIFENPELL